MEEELSEVKGKKHKLEVKISSGTLFDNNLITIEGENCINMTEIIEQQIIDEREFIIFGYVGVRRDLIEWYRITEIQ